MRLCVGIATSGRRDMLSALLRIMADQARAPDLLTICPAHPADVDEAVLAELPFPCEIVRPRRAGLSSQRNEILRRTAGFDVLVFFDDDFVPNRDFLRECERLFERCDGVVMATGKVLVDGVHTAGIPLEEALAAIGADLPPPEPTLEDVNNCYGCNMALRPAVALRHGVEFDENLPLYAWLEDVDFSRRMAPFGRVVKTDACRGVHMATKRGKVSGLRLGYSQVANPIYLWRKRTMTLPHALKQIGRNFAANLAKAAAPEPWVDRRGRLAGNLHAVCDAIGGKLHPTNIDRSERAPPHRSRRAQTDV